MTGAARDAVFMAASDDNRLGLSNKDSITLVNEAGRYDGHVFIAPIAPGNLQVHWPEGNVLLRAGLVDSASGVPDYNAVVNVERRTS